MSILSSMSRPVYGMTIEDDRTEAEKKTHTVIIAMTDSFMSGWGRAGSNGVSYAGWAAKPEDADVVERWVRGRSDAKRVRVVSALGNRR